MTSLLNRLQEHAVRRLCGSAAISGASSRIIAALRESGLDLDLLVPDCEHALRVTERMKTVTMSGTVNSWLPTQVVKCRNTPWAFLPLVLRRCGCRFEIDTSRNLPLPLAWDPRCQQARVPSMPQPFSGRSRLLPHGNVEPRQLLLRWPRPQIASCESLVKDFEGLVFPNIRHTERQRRPSRRHPRPRETNIGTERPAQRILPRQNRQQAIDPYSENSLL